MKKIEKVFYVNYEAFGCLKKGGYDYISMSVTDAPSEIHRDKITITYEVPEKKVTISESEFDRIYMRVNQTNVETTF